MDVTDIVPHQQNHHQNRSRCKSEWFSKVEGGLKTSFVYQGEQLDNRNN
jgi:hypothetical protein